MVPKLANMKPVANPNVPPCRMLLPAYTAREPMIKSTIPQTATNGMNTSISRRLYSQVLLANSEIASRMWKPPSTNIIIAAYVSQPGRLIVVGVLSLLCSTISSFLSHLSLLRVSVRWHHAMVYGSPQKKGAPTPRGWVALIHRVSERDCLKNSDDGIWSVLLSTCSPKIGLLCPVSPVRKGSVQAPERFFKQSQRAHSRKPVYEAVKPYAIGPGLRPRAWLGWLVRDIVGSPWCMTFEEKMEEWT